MFCGKTGHTGDKMSPFFDFYISRDNVSRTEPQQDFSRTGCKGNRVNRDLVTTKSFQ